MHIGILSLQVRQIQGQHRILLLIQRGQIHTIPTRIGARLVCVSVSPIKVNCIGFGTAVTPAYAEHRYRQQHGEGTK